MQYLFTLFSLLLLLACSTSHTDKQTYPTTGQIERLDPQGNLFTAAPGGIWIFSPDHQLLGKIKSEFWASNCNFNADFSTLYITADDHLLRVKLR